MKSGRFASFLLALLAVLPVAASVAAPVADAPALAGTAWVLTALSGGPVLERPLVTLQFDGSRLAGSDGCNRYGGSYTVQGSAIDIPGRLASTQMACPPPVGEQAKAYLDALTGAKSWRITGERLELIGADGVARATFVAQSLVLEGTSWQATGINNGRQAVVSVLQDSLVTLSFGAKGDASGSAGCNRYSVRYETSGSTLAFGPAATTRMACPAPGVMEQERQFLDALATVKTVRMEGDRLELRTAEGALAATFTRRPGG